jgi:hypothetical protein
VQRLGARHTATFIVRIWTEYLTPEHSLWRGEIENVRTQEVVRFRELGQIEAYMQRCALEQTLSSNKEETT